MLRTTCWNCGARLSGPRCQMCGAAQNGPGDQPGEQQAARATYPSSPDMGAYVPNRQPRYIPGGQPGMGWYGQRESYEEPYEESYAPNAPDQPPDVRSYGMRGLSLSRGVSPYIPGGPPQPSYPAMLDPQPMEPAPVARSSVSEALSVPLATLGGLIAGIVSAAIWAVMLDTTRINFAYVAFLLGIV